MEKFSCTLMTALLMILVTTLLTSCGLEEVFSAEFGDADTSVTPQGPSIPVDSVRIAYVPSQDTSGADFDHRGLPDVFFRMRSWSPGISLFPFPWTEEAHEGEWYKSDIKENLGPQQSRVWSTPELDLHTKSYDQCQIMDYDHDSPHDVIWTVLFDWDLDDESIVPDSIHTVLANGVEITFYLHQP